SKPGSFRLPNAIEPPGETGPVRVDKNPNAVGRYHVCRHQGYPIRLTTQVGARLNGVAPVGNAGAAESESAVPRVGGAGDERRRQVADQELASGAVELLAVRIKAGDRKRGVGRHAADAQDAIGAHAGARMRIRPNGGGKREVGWAVK